MTRRTWMNIKIVKPGSFKAKPLTSCPLLVDDDGGLSPRK
jgi:hypothetical protein